MIRCAAPPGADRQPARGRRRFARDLGPRALERAAHGPLRKLVPANLPDPGTAGARTAARFRAKLRIRPPRPAPPWDDSPPARSSCRSSCSASRLPPRRRRSRRPSRPGRATITPPPGSPTTPGKRAQRTTACGTQDPPITRSPTPRPGPSASSRPSATSGRCPTRWWRRWRSSPA